VILAWPAWPRDHDGEQLQDDACGDVRHDAERKHRQPVQRATAEQVDQLEQAGVAALDQVEAGVDGPLRDPGGRQRGAQPEYGNDEDRKQQLLTQVRRAKGAYERGQHA
jgi:hypothetical protein